MAGKYGHQWRLALALTAAVSATLVLDAKDTVLAQAAANAAPAADAADQQKQAVPVPPGMDEALLQPRQGEALQKARLTLPQVLQTLELPAVLERRQAQPQDDQQKSQEPPVAAQQLYVQGREALLEQRHFDAITHLEAAQKLAPDNAAILAELGQIYTSSGNVAQGARYFERAVEADPTELESVFMVGRLAVERNRWPAAIAWLSHGLTISDDAADPAYVPLMRFYLGSALEQEGYDAAAIEQYQAYLNMPSWQARSSRLARQLSLLQRLKPVKLLSLGDAWHRLGQPEKALAAYNNAIEFNVGDQPQLIARLIYTDLLLGNADRAQQRVAKALAEQPASKQVMQLVEYLHTAAPQHGPALVEALRDVYNQSGKPASLIITLSSLVPPAQGGELLQQHLRDKPDDREVFVELLQRQLTEDGKGLPDAIRSGADIVDARPQALEATLTALIDAAGGARQMLEAIDQLPPDQQQRPAVRSMRGMSLALTGRVDEATEALRQAVNEQPQAGPRVPLARLLIAREQFDEAKAVLEPMMAEGKPADAEAVALYVQVLVHSDEFEKAVQLLDGLIEREPDNIELVLNKAQLQVAQLQERREAERTLLDALNRHPKDERLYEALLSLYDNSNGEMMREWQQLMRRMLSEIPDSRFARLERAKLLAHNNPALAERLLQGLLQENPQDYGALEAWLGLLVSTNRREQATSLLEKKLREAPADESLLQLAIRYYRNEGRDQQRVIDLSERLIRLQPESVARTETLAVLYLSSERPEKALAEILATLETKLQDPSQLYLLLGKALVLTDEAGKIDEHFNKALKRFPDHAEKLTLHWALVLNDAQQPQRMAEVLWSFLDTGKAEDPTVMLELLSMALKQSGQPEKFDDYAAKAVQKYPKHEADLTYTWAIVYDRAGDQPRSEQMLEKLLQEHPDHAMANNHLGYTWANTDRNLDRAKEMIARAVKAEPDSAAFLDSMGWVHYKLGDFNEAVTWLKKAIEAKGGSHPVIMDHLGDALYRSGDTGAAARVWQQAREGLTAPNVGSDPETLLLLERLPQKINSLRRQGSKPPIASSPGGDMAK